MKTEIEEKTEVQKKAYSSPKLVYYGAVKDLTLAGSETSKTKDNTVTKPEDVQTYRS